MRIEITKDFINRLTRALKKEVAPGCYCWIEQVTVNFIENTHYLIYVKWGNDDKDKHYGVELFCDDTDNIDFLRGQFARVIYQHESAEDNL